MCGGDRSRCSLACRWPGCRDGARGAGTAGDDAGGNRGGDGGNRGPRRGVDGRSAEARQADRHLLVADRFGADGRIRVGSCFRKTFFFSAGPWIHPAGLWNPPSEVAGDPSVGCGPAEFPLAELIRGRVRIRRGKSGRLKNGGVGRNLQSGDPTPFCLSGSRG